MATTMHDLGELRNILDEIGADMEDISSSSSGEDEGEDDVDVDTDETIDMMNTIIQLMYDYVAANPTSVQEITFHEDMMRSVDELVEEMLQGCQVGEEDGANKNEYSHATIDQIIKHAVELFYVQVMPMRSSGDTHVFDHPGCIPYHKRISGLRTTLSKLNGKPQHEQRTSEWYTYRHGLITASNAYKIFESQCTQNQLIYEKCQPVQTGNSGDGGDQSDLNIYVSTDELGIFGGLGTVSRTETELIADYANGCSNVELSVNVGSPMHWGQKYEPVSVMYYEQHYGTRVDEYGCIQHDLYSFLGASPDGIVTDISSSRYGRMLEIKNIVNREITGIPAKAYWVQMQLQMEVCGLDECDFLETRFKEYPDESAFDADAGLALEFAETASGKPKGIVLMFASAAPARAPIYEYMPLGATRDESEYWRDDMMKSHRGQGHLFMKTLYWWMEEVSCVLVLRNKIWFSMNIDTMKSFWDIILQERVSGYSHRAPNKRRGVDKNKCVDDGFQQCLISVDGSLLLGSTTPTPRPTPTPTSTTSVKDSGSPAPQQSHIHIRTQSMDATQDQLHILPPSPNNVYTGFAAETTPDTGTGIPDCDCPIQ